MVAVGDVVEVQRKGYKGRTGTVESLNGTLAKVVLADTGKWLWCFQDEMRRRRPFEVDDEPPARIDQAVHAVERIRVLGDYAPQPLPGQRLLPRGEFIDKYTGQWITTTFRQYLEAIGWR